MVDRASLFARRPSQGRLRQRRHLVGQPGPRRDTHGDGGGFHNAEARRLLAERRRRDGYDGIALSYGQPEAVKTWKVGY